MVGREERALALGETGAAPATSVMTLETAQMQRLLNAVSPRLAEAAEAAEAADLLSARLRLPLKRSAVLPVSKPLPAKR